MSDPVIRTEALTKTYGTFKAVDDLSFEVQAGEIVGLLRQNRAAAGGGQGCFNGDNR